MNIPLQITFRNMPPSKAIEDNVREKTAKLENFFDRIMSCRVIIEAPHRHHHKGKTYVVRIDLTVPGAELAVNRAPKHLAATKLQLAGRDERDSVESHEPSKHGAHEDIYVAIRDAFNAAGRKLQDYVRRQSGVVKAHETRPLARVTKLVPQERYGFLGTADGREIYFHGNSVLGLGYDRLEVGTRVLFSEEAGDKGPQASMVRVTGR